MMNIPARRLCNQRLNSTSFETAAEVVAWLGAVQAQDYPGAKWAVAQRTIGLTDADLDRALADGSILRTHVLRPTWHFVTPEDIRWMLALTGARVNAKMGYYNRQLELDDALFARANDLIAGALEGGSQLTRAELAAVLAQAGIATDNVQRMGHIMGRAELDGIVCSGAMRGKQQTYALLDERAPQGKTFTRDEALAELARRYFTSHGPATVQDFIWWSGLTASNARAGLESVKDALSSEIVNGREMWFSEDAATAAQPSAYLLPNYDEYLVAYEDRSDIFPSSDVHQLDPYGNILFSHTLVIDGLIAGTWKRAFKKNAAFVDVRLIAPLSEAENEAFSAAVDRYSTFYDLPVVVSIQNGVAA